MSSTAQVKEMFVSIQGEGVYIGYKQLFIRFSGCNLKCSYCDTEHLSGTVCYTPEKLAQEVSKYETQNIHSISLTGGEPLLHAGFLKDFLPLCSTKIYLETNGTLIEPFANVAKYVDIAAVDLKLNSVSNQGNLFLTHDKFIEIAVKNNIETFVKVVFDKNIESTEIENCVNICKKYAIPLILQPVMSANQLTLSGEQINDIFGKFTCEYDNVRLIPQVHKFLNVE